MNQEDQVSKHPTILWANINTIQQNDYYIYVLIYIKIISNKISKYLRIALKFMTNQMYKKIKSN